MVILHVLQLYLCNPAGKTHVPFAVDPESGCDAPRFNKTVVRARKPIAEKLRIVQFWRLKELFAMVFCTRRPVSRVGHLLEFWTAVFQCSAPSGFPILGPPSGLAVYQSTSGISCVRGFEIWIWTFRSDSVRTKVSSGAVDLQRTSRTCEVALL